MKPSLWFWIGGLCLLVGAIVRAADWPTNYVVAEDTTSPDRGFGLIVLSHEAAVEDGASDTNEVHVADLHEHKSLGTIKEIDYFQNQNHRGLQACWSGDSRACVVVGEGRYGADNIILIQLEKVAFRQSDIGKRIFDAVKPVVDGYVNPYFHFGTGHKLAVRATIYTNPKQLEDAISEYALFRGNFDIATEKWSGLSVRRLKLDDYDAIESALLDDPTKHLVGSTDDEQSYSVVHENGVTVHPSEEDRLKELDGLLNAAYAGDRVLLSPTRFARLKDEQRQWLKQREAASGIADKSKMTQQRIKELQDLLWQN